MKFAELVVRAFCLVTSCLPVKSWARPGTLRDGREKRKVIVGGGEGMKRHQQDRRVLPYRTVVVLVLLTECSPWAAKHCRHTSSLCSLAPISQAL